MRNPGNVTVEVWEPGGLGPYDPDTLEQPELPPILHATVRANVGTLKAEERYERSTLDETVNGYALVPLDTPVTSDRYLVVHGHAAIAGRWNIVGIEWRRTHLRVLILQGFQSY